MILVMVTVEVRRHWCCGVGLFSIHTRSLFVNKVRKKKEKIYQGLDTDASRAPVVNVVAVAIIVIIACGDSGSALVAAALVVLERWWWFMFILMLIR